MTGYGVHTYEDDTVSITVEVKSLNSKQTDLNVRLPRIVNDKELEIRTQVAKALGRGKVSVMIDVSQHGDASNKAKIDKGLAIEYYNELKEIATEVGADASDLFRQAILMPQVIQSNTSEGLSEEQQKALMTTVTEATVKCIEFRSQEGDALSVKLSEYITTISNLLEEVIKYDPERVEGIKARIQESLEKNVGVDNVDTNRFEQELIYYIEKLDITEEKVRLRNHLDYFTEILNAKDSNGKKLGFIGQEIGREINTIGSKANNATVQQLVVNMKDELEKIKEQVLNVL